MSDRRRGTRRALWTLGAGLGLLAFAVWYQRHFDLPFLSGDRDLTLRESTEMRKLLKRRAQAGGPSDWIGDIPESDARELFAMLATDQAIYRPDVLWVRRPDLDYPRSSRSIRGAPLPFGRTRTDSARRKSCRRIPSIAYSSWATRTPTGSATIPTPFPIAWKHG